MIGTIVPRPIALVTTVDAQGRVNAAPFSFFNCLSHDPPILALGVENHPDMSFKDTAGNIRVTEVFTVNIVSHAIAEATRPVRKNEKRTQLWGPSGATIWSAPTIDPKRGRLYVATGNSYSDPAAKAPKVQTLISKLFPKPLRDGD